MRSTSQVLQLLRDYQGEAVGKVLDWAADHDSGRLLLVMPLASGKTIVIATILQYLAVATGLRALVVAHRREIIEQHYRVIVNKAGMDPRDVGIIMGDDKRTNPAAIVQIGSIDTLRSRPPEGIDILVTDESHRDAATTRRWLANQYPNAFKLGLTAAPMRIDNRSLADDFDEILVVSSYGELIQHGWVAAPTVFTLPEEQAPRLHGLRTVHGDYDADEVDRLLNVDSFTHYIREHWQQKAAGRPTVAFAASIRHSKRLVDFFCQAGIRAAHVDLKTNQRTDVLQRIEDGSIQIVSCVDLLSEGWDCPPAKCAILARPTMSTGLFLQQCGRVMRPWKGCKPIILDHVGNVIWHGLPHMERTWSLNTRQRGRQPQAKACSQCHAVAAMTAATCDQCGADWPSPTPPKPATTSPVPSEQTSSQHDADADEHGDTLGHPDNSYLKEYWLTGREQQLEVVRLRALATGRGLPESWIAQAFHAKYGRQPDRSRA